jgi:hypothetical protein
MKRIDMRCAIPKGTVVAPGKNCVASRPSVAIEV